MIPFGCLIPSAAAAEALNAAIMSRNPWGYWKLNETTGATLANDSSGNGRHLGNYLHSRSAGAALIAEGGGSAQFTRANSNRIWSTETEYGAAAKAAFGGTDQPFSIFAIVRFDVVDSNTHAIFHIGDYGSHQGIAFYRSGGNGKVWCEFVSGGWKYAGTASSVAANTTYVLGAIRTAAGNLQFYLNGAANGSPMTGTGGALNLSTTNNFISIGDGRLGGTAQMDGRIQHLAIFTSDIGAAGMTALYNATGL